MTGLCGWFDAGPADPVGPDRLARMSATLTRFDGNTVRSASSGFGTVAVAGTDRVADVYQDDGRLVAIWGHAGFADPSLAELAARSGSAAALARGHEQRGSEVFAQLSGGFALAILDGRAGEALLAADRMGAHPLHYAVSAGRLSFASTLDAIAALSAHPLDIDRQSIYDYLYFHVIPGPSTIYSACRRLLPGEYLHYRNGRADTRRYWSMRFIEDAREPFGDLKEEFQQVLRDSVRAMAVPIERTGAFLSGGTDSSTLAGMLGAVSGAPARTYSIGFEAEGYDETGYARIAARHFKTRHSEYYVTPEDVIDAIPQIAAVHDQPFGNSSAVPTYCCAKLARADGIEVLLGGDGGDELFGGNERYAKQYLYSLYSDLPPGLRRNLIEPVVFALPASIGIAGKVQRYMKNASVPMPARYDNYNLLERLGAATVFTSEFLETVDPRLPASRMAAEYRGTDAGSLINRMLAFDFKYTLADNDLPKVMRSCELAGVEVRFPMLADAVVDFSARLAPDWKLRRTRLRHFFKEALRDFLPEEIIRKSKHGFGLPFGVWMQTHPRLMELVMDSLAGLRRRSFIQPQFIDELMGARVAEHAAYYGTMAWVLMMLEQWFRQHGAGSPPSP